MLPRDTVRIDFCPGRGVEDGQVVIQAVGNEHVPRIERGQTLVRLVSDSQRDRVGRVVDIEDLDVVRQLVRDVRSLRTGGRGQQGQDRERTDEMPREHAREYTGNRPFAAVNPPILRPAGPPGRRAAHDRASGPARSPVSLESTRRH